MSLYILLIVFLSLQGYRERNLLGLVGRLGRRKDESRFSLLPVSIGIISDLCVLCCHRSQTSVGCEALVQIRALQQTGGIVGPNDIVNVIFLEDQIDDFATIGSQRNKDSLIASSSSRGTVFGSGDGTWVSDDEPHRGVLAKLAVGDGQDFKVVTFLVEFSEVAFKVDSLEAEDGSFDDHVFAFVCVVVVWIL